MEIELSAASLKLNASQLVPYELRWAPAPRRKVYNNDDMVTNHINDKDTQHMKELDITN